MATKKSITFVIHTIGCKTNQAESDDIARQLVLMGCLQVDISAAVGTAAGANGANDDSGADSDSGGIDYIIINTCTVTAAADRKARHLIRKLKSASPKSKLIITGCFAELNSELIAGISVNSIFSNNKKNEIAEFICREVYKKAGLIAGLKQTNKAAWTGKVDTASAARQTTKASEAKATASILKPVESVQKTAEPGHVHSRAFVKIQDGCQQGCAYCIVPKARGPYSSTDPEKIIDDIKNLVYHGHDEIVLTGIHVGKFGVDLLSKKTPIKNLSELVLEVLKSTTVKRLRLSSIEINEIDESLIGVIRNNGSRLAPHLHIPLQSGSDNMLKAMNRKYDRSFFISAIEHIKKAIPDITLTTDIIVGFPGETGQDFTDTVELVKNINFSKLHVFKYSIRPGTKASGMEGQVQENIKTERSRILRALGLDLRISFVASNISKKLDVVCEEYDIKSNVSGGTAENYIKVYFDLNFEEYKLKKSKILKVFTKSLYADGLYGEVI